MVEHVGTSRAGENGAENKFLNAPGCPTEGLEVCRAADHRFLFEVGENSRAILGIFIEMP